MRLIKVLSSVCLWILALSWFGGMAGIGYQIVTQERSKQKNHGVSQWQLDGTAVAQAAAEAAPTGERLQPAVPRFLNEDMSSEYSEAGNPKNVAHQKLAATDAENYQVQGAGVAEFNRNSYRKEAASGLYQSGDGHVLFYDAIHDRWCIGPDTHPAHALYSAASLSGFVPPHKGWEVTLMGKSPAPFVVPVRPQLREKSRLVKAAN